MKKENKLGRYEKGVIITGVAVVIIFLILLTADGIKNIGKNKQNIALSEQEEVITTEPNKPTMSAGMIPVKYEGDNLIICKNDNTWYNYEAGIPAYMMLNDGVYQSELVENMTGKKLANENMGQVVQINKQGTIYMWIPRYAKNVVTGEIKYVSQETQLGRDFEVSDAFMYKQTDETKPDFSLSGIWVEKIPLANSNLTNTKIVNMNKEENVYGFIANTIGFSVYSNQNIKSTIEEYMANFVGADDPVCPITDLSNTNRTVLKIINDKYYEPIKAKIEYNEAEGTVVVTITYNKNEITKIEDKDGNGIGFNRENGTIKAITKARGGKNHFTIIDEKGNRKELEVTVVLPIYAKLYADDTGRTLAFTASNKTLEGKTLVKTYGDISKVNVYSNTTIPWKNEVSTITTVDIVDEIEPMATAYWFWDCANLTSIANIANLNTSNVTNMGSMFSGCKALIDLDLSSFDTSNVTYMGVMFYNCGSLISLDLSNFRTNNVTHMNNMFSNCSGLTELDVSKFNTSSVTYMNSMFYNCKSLTELDVSKFNTSSVTYMNNMFSNCSGLTELDVSNFDTKNVTEMSGMFSSCSGLIQLDVRNFNTRNVTNMGSMFNGCSSLTKLDLSNFITNKVTNFQNMFYNCKSLTELDLGNFYTYSVTNMSSMFQNCTSLSKLNVDNFYTYNVTNMQNMFRKCSSLTVLDISSFNTIKAKDNMRYIFMDCTRLRTIYVGTGWKTNGESNQFSGCGTSTTTLKK